jgi:hypothetical protein
MSTRRLSYAKLKSGLRTQALAYTFGKGHGGVLAFAWAVGAGLLTTVYPMPLLAAALTGSMAVLTGLMARGYLGGRESRGELLRAVLARHLDVGALEQGAARDAVARGAHFYVEIAAKVDDITAAHGVSEDLERVLTTACELLALQYESAERVQEYARIMGLLRVDARSGDRRPAPGGPQGLETMAGLLSEEQACVVEVNVKLEAVLLQVLQVARGTTDFLRAAQFAEEADSSLRYLQAVVEARKETADMIRRSMPVSSP